MAAHTVILALETLSRNGDQPSLWNEFRASQGCSVRLFKKKPSVYDKGTPPGIHHLYGLI